MAQATNESFLSGQPESSTAATILRNDDPFTRALRNDPTLELTEIIHLNRTLSPTHDTLSSHASTSTVPVFSVRNESTVTKPTSTGTPYPSHLNNDQGKAKVSYASSLSVANGSGSEAEAEQHAVRHDDLLAMGGWAKDGSEPLRGAARAQQRGRDNRQPKLKKPAVNFSQAIHATVEAPIEHKVSIIPTASVEDGPEQSVLRRRATQPYQDHDHDDVSLAEEGQPPLTFAQALVRKPLSRIRKYVLVSLAVAMTLTIALSAFAAHHTGKAQMGCTKRIVYGATVLIAVLTFLAMLVARRALLEALLAGLVEIIMGFMLLAQLNDFM